MQRLIEFGIEVEQFLGSEIGKYLVEKAEGEIEAAVEQLKTIDPKESDQIRELQNAIHRAESIQYWLAEAIQEGLNAAREIEEERE